MATTTAPKEIDVAGRPLGRAASEIAVELMGKNLPSFDPARLANVTVVVWNADHVALTGKKRTQKLRYHFSGYPGGLKATRIGDAIAKDSARVLRDAVRRMLPKNKLQAKLLHQLIIHGGPKV
jgi:large subunit ribosomal protein L13